MIIGRIQAIRRRFYNRYLRNKGAKITPAFVCSPDAVEGMISGLSGDGNAVCEKGAKLLIGLNNNGNAGKLHIGQGFYINRYSVIDCHFSITIGRNVQIGPHCYITDFDHALKVHQDNAIHRSQKVYKAVVIKDNAWIGAGAIILKGVTIGSNAVIGAGSVVTKDVPDNALFAGNPAKLIRML
jgi:acetyltransferase-like isoleucine patch superfamily enzyme